MDEALARLIKLKEKLENQPDKMSELSRVQAQIDMYKSMGNNIFP